MLASSSLLASLGGLPSSIADPLRTVPVGSYSSYLAHYISLLPDLLARRPRAVRGANVTRVRTDIRRGCPFAAPSPLRSTEKRQLPDHGASKSYAVGDPTHSAVFPGPHHRCVPTRREVGSSSHSRILS